MPVEFFPINGTMIPLASGPGGIVVPNWDEPEPEVIGADSNNMTYDGQPTKVEAQSTNLYQIALPVIFAIIITVGVVGNIMVMVVIATRRKMRTVTNFLLFNLAISDVAFLVICGPFTMAHYALDSWLLGNAMCQVIQYFLYVTCYVTVYTLVTVAVVRYVLMVRLSTHPCVKNPRYILYIILGIWSASLLINIPVPLSHGVSYSWRDNTTECVITCHDTGKLFFSLFSVFAFALPLAIVAVLYTRLVLHLRKNQRNSMIGKCHDKDEEKSCKTGSSRKNRHVTRVLILVVAVFAVCWLPLHVHLLWGTFGQLPTTTAYNTVLILWYSLVFSNSALNPIIYHFFSSEFRENFRKICRSPLHREGSSTSGTSGSKGLLVKTSSV